MYQANIPVETTFHGFTDPSYKHTCLVADDSQIKTHDHKNNQKCWKNVAK